MALIKTKSHLIEYVKNGKVSRIKITRDSISCENCEPEKICAHLVSFAKDIELQHKLYQNKISIDSKHVNYILNNQQPIRI
ncbi:MAG: hypothetical protein OEY10_01065 [Nitrosopumilus sp.]|nr:hypothetical protein [Nitrosopumilus sp.]